jgi:hypothetical protein
MTIPKLAKEFLKTADACTIPGTDPKPARSMTDFERISQEESMGIMRSDVNSLASKLEKFAQDLPAQEQNVLNWLLARARQVAEGEVSVEDLDSAAGGLAPTADDVIIPDWSR